MDNARDHETSCVNTPYPLSSHPQPVRAARRLFGLSYAFNLTGFGFLSLGRSMVHRHRNGADKDEPNRARTFVVGLSGWLQLRSWWRSVATISHTTSTDHFTLRSAVTYSTTIHLEFMHYSARDTTCKYRWFYVYPDYARAYEKLEFLWAALESRNAEVRAGKQKRDVKTSESPNLYQCAVEHCGIVAAKKSGLSQCGAPCLPDIKPSYYSKDCQRAVRFRASNPVRVADNSV